MKKERREKKAGEGKNGKDKGVRREGEKWKE